jgi:lipoyl synthase
MTPPDKSTQPAPIPLKTPKPSWLKVPLPGGEGYTRLKTLTQELKLNTVCQEARCPNIGECWKGEHATMTIMVLGRTTRSASARSASARRRR